MSDKTTYIPGVCNIGKKEIQVRWTAAWAGAILTLAVVALLVTFKAPWYLAVLVFLPASLGAVSFQQAYFHFCVKFGMSGVFNFGPEVGKTDTVEQAEFRKKDRATALRMITLGVLFALAATGLTGWVLALNTAV